MKLPTKALFILFTLFSFILANSQENPNPDTEFDKYAPALPEKTEYRFVKNFELLNSKQVTKLFWAEYDEVSLLSIKSSGVPNCVAISNPNGLWAIYKELKDKSLQKIIVSKKTENEIIFYMITNKNELYPIVMNENELYPIITDHDLEKEDITKILISYKRYWNSKI